MADGDGFWPQRYVTEDAKAVVTTSADVALYTLDPAPTSQGTGAAASAVSFNPTISIPETNVQDAIEAAANLAISGFAIFGLGITGNATLLAALDATGTGAGLYRFDGTTTGTYPTGVVAGDTGLVELWRQAGATAMQVLYHATSDRVFHRRMASSAWGTWRENIEVNQGAAEGDMIYRSASAWTRLAKGAANQLLRINSGATSPEWGSTLDAPGSAPVYGCRCWGNLNGTGTIALRDSGNVASVTDNGTGNYTVTMTTAMPDANYCVLVSGNSGNSGAGGSINDWYSAYAISTTQFLITAYDQAGVAIDPQTICFAVFG